MTQSQALYRQYRPQRFADVIGQDVAVRTLRNAVEQDKVAHAYLFTGTKGTGKTTLAKLLAKAMNCENGPTIDPCGVCEECRAIAEGRSMDVAEIDAASNTGIDTVREKIIDTVAFQPSRGSRRVYIIDEAHQLSKAAFNALLKTIEEPPPHVMFVFCTTETHMMMATVRDRCQRIAMRSPGPEALLEVLTKVATDEGIQADEQALRAVARAAQGSFRNALGTLEMLTTTFGNSFTREEVQQHLGVVSEAALFEMTDALIDADPGAALRLIDTLAHEGVDLDQFARSLAEHVRGVLLAKHGVIEAANVGDSARLTAQAERADERRMLAAIDCIADAATRIRVGSDARISVETALVRACQGLGLPLLALRLAALEQKVQGGYGLPVSSAPTPAGAGSGSTPSAASAVVAPSGGSTPAIAVKEPMSDAELAQYAAWWPQVVQRVAQVAAYKPMLQGLTVTGIDGSKLTLGSTGPVMAKLKSALVDATRDVTGHAMSIEVEQTAPAAAPTAPTSAPSAPVPDKHVPAPPAPTQPPAAPATDDPGVANVMSMFDATPVATGASSDDADGDR